MSWVIGGFRHVGQYPVRVTEQHTWTSYQYSLEVSKWIKMVQIDMSPIRFGMETWSQGKHTSLVCGLPDTEDKTPEPLDAMSGGKPQMLMCYLLLGRETAVHETHVCMKICGCVVAICLPVFISAMFLSAVRCFCQPRDFIWQGIPQVPPGLATNSHKTLIDSSTSCLGSLTCFFGLSLLLLWSSFTPMSLTLHFYVIDLVWLGVWW